MFIVQLGTRGASRMVEACFNISTKVGNVEPVAYKDY